jgi:Fe-S-cluster-containing dehydrogenase component
VLACPFGVPQYVVAIDQMVKCDMCFDRTSIGKKPMCATVCPSQALYYGYAEDMERLRREDPIDKFQFGQQAVRTKVKIMSSPGSDQMDFDIMNYMLGSEELMPDLAELSICKE